MSAAVPFMTERGRLPASLSRPGLIAFLAMAGGQVFAGALALEQWPLLAAAMAIFFASWPFLKVESRWFAGAFCGAFLLLGAAREAHLVQTDRRESEFLKTQTGPSAPLASIEGVIATALRETPWNWSFELQPGARIGIRGEIFEFFAPVAIRIPREDAPVELSDWIPGDSIRVSGRLEPLPVARAGPGAVERYAKPGAAALLRAETVVRLHAPDHLGARFLRSAQRIANAAEREVRALLPPEQAALMTSLTLGRTEGLSAEQRETFRRTGLMHLFAVSGLHTGLIGGLVLLVLRSAGIPIRVRLALLFLVLAFFVAFQGLRPSVFRAAVLIWILDAQNLLRRPTDSLAALGTVASLMLLWDPRQLWKLDFQLTFLCVAAIIAATPWRLELRKSLGARLGWGWKAKPLIAGAEIFLYSLAIQLATAPLLIGVFGGFSLISPIANTLLIIPASFFIQFAFLCFASLLAVPVAGEALITGVCGPVLAAFEMIAQLIGSMPASFIEPRHFPAWQALLYYGALLSGAWMQAWRQHMPRRKIWQFIPGALLLAVITLFPWKAFEPQEFEVWFFDVGQGDATFIRTEEGRTMLVDAGPEFEGGRLPEKLHRLGVTHLDALVATHADADHIGGMAELITQIPVNQLFVGGSIAETERFLALRDAVKENNLPVTIVQRGSQIRFGDLNVQVLHPVPAFLEEGDSRNDASVVLRFSHDGITFLLTGDAEFDAEDSMIGDRLPLSADVLKCGHHGSEDSSSEQFLEAVAPTVAVASSGRFNRYGHPDQELVGRLEKRNVQLLRTDLHGSIRMTVSNGAIMIQTAR